jgi:3-methyladenine DNA glycosylase AlkD
MDDRQSSRVDASPSDLATEVESRLRALPSLNTETARSLRREYSKVIAKSSPQFVVELAARLLDRGSIIHRFIGYGLVHSHREALGSLRSSDLERLGRGLDSWGAVDTFGCYLSGPAWREHQVPDSLIRRWARSRDRWWRRAALVSTVPLNNKARGGSGDPSRTLEICAMLVADEDDMVVKALSWALRELAKRDPNAVKRFVNQHREALAARVIREVGNKLTTGLKNPKNPRLS